ncbi:MAG: hypothetical protein B6229_02740 [Spirochaetaceae bacterium 4572_7]|nr:MAG: hypothetical protein B6229_02740 [Spirochaetaceae bacterium 4572_7]
MNRIATDGILLSVVIVAIISTVGLLTIPPLFTALGATPDIIPIISQYMTTWYAGVIFVVMPPVSDTAMRSIGDMKRPLYVMLVCALVNVALDPILIFGKFGFPEMGIRGAAVATIISRFAGAILSLSFIHFKYRLIDFKYNSVSELLTSWKNILKIGIPGALIRLLPQLVRGLLTKMAATVGGTTAVAAIAAGSRIESFSAIVSMAIGVSLVPIMGQNYGAGNLNRVEESRKLILKLAIIFGVILTSITVMFWRPLALIFSKDQAVITYIGKYLIIVMIGSAGLNLYNWLSEGLNAIGKPRIALKINLYGTLFLIIPGIILGGYIGNFMGMLIGLSLGQLILGTISEHIAKNQFK